MKGLINTLLVIAVVSVVLGIVSRLLFVPLPIAPGGINAGAFLVFANSCLLLAIALLLKK